MEFSAQSIALLLNGEIDGNPEVTVKSVAKIEEAAIGDIAFLGNMLYEKYLYTTNASIVLINKSFVPQKKTNPTLIKVENVYQSFATLLEAYQKIKNQKNGIERPTFISQTAKTGNNVYVGAFAYLSENVTIGNDTKIFPNVFLGDNVKIGNNCNIYSGVKIYNDCKIGDNCTIHSNSVIGADGFGFAPQSDDNYKKVPQVGNVVIEENVEIGSNTTVDRATLGSTIIRKGVKLDNLIQVAHNVEIGENTVIAAQTGIAGSTKIGKNCMIGGQCGFAGHLVIGNNVKIAAQSGIGNNIKDNEIIQGSPAFSIKDYQKSYVMFRNLPDFFKKFNQLQKEIEQIKQSAK